MATSSFGSPRKSIRAQVENSFISQSGAEGLLMKRALGILLVIAVLAGLVWYLNARQGAQPGSAGAAGLACHVYKEPKKAVAADPAVPRLAENKAPAYKVLSVTDGDTLVKAKNGETRVRLIGMDAPEKSATRYGYTEYYGQEAYQRAKALIDASGGEVRLTYDREKTDQYGRDLAYVWLKDGRLLNAILVADGYAYAYTVGAKPKYADTFLALMRDARSHDKGLWGVCS
jgi:micrococcal nuclease